MKSEKKHKFTLTDLEINAKRAAGAASAQLPGPQLRELIRLAMIGWKVENPEQPKAVEQ